MHIKHLALSTTLLLSLIQSPITLAKTTSNDLAEWELLKAYLEQVERRSELEIQVAQSDYKFKKLVFKEYSRRWWEMYRNDQRQEKAFEYWARFREGENYAYSLVERSAVGNYCKLLNQVDISGRQSPAEEEVMFSAFERGFKSAFPECKIPNLDQFLRETDKKISFVESKVTDLKVKLLLTKPNETEIETIYSDLKKKYTETIKNYVADSKTKLENALPLPTSDLKRVTESATYLAQTINCASLVSRDGSRFDCNVRVIDPAVKLGLASTYRILQGDQETGAFQPRLYLGQLLLASAVYLREVNPSNQMVQFLANDISVSLNKIQNESERRFENARILIAEDFEAKMRALRIDTIELNRSSLPKDAMLSIVKELLDIKPTIQSYVRLDMATQLEESILDRVLEHYRGTLNKAAALKAEVKLPSRNVIITLEDVETSDVVTLDPLPLPPVAYLLGMNPEDVQEWMEILAL